MAKFIFDSLEEMKEFITEMGYTKAIANTENEKTKTKDTTVKEIETEDKYLTVPEIAKIFGVCHQAIDWHIKKTNGLPCIRKENRTRLIKLSDAEKYFANHPFQKGGRKVKLTHSSYSIWQKEIFAKMKKHGLEYNKTSSLIFTKMRNVYGIVWEQIKKDYFEHYGKSAASTMQMCYFVEYVQEHKPNEHYENLFENELDAIIERKEKINA